jgi:FkbM family methyltransferase
MPRPDFVKVDVEGAELLVLEGAHEMISQVRPVFYIEVGKENFIRTNPVRTA